MSLPRQTFLSLFMAVGCSHVSTEETFRCIKTNCHLCHGGQLWPGHSVKKVRGCETENYPLYYVMDLLKTTETEALPCVSVITDLIQYL